MSINQREGEEGSRGYVMIGRGWRQENAGGGPRDGWSCENLKQAIYRCMLRKHCIKSGLCSGLETCRPFDGLSSLSTDNFAKAFKNGKTRKRVHGDVRTTSRCRLLALAAVKYVWKGASFWEPIIQGQL